MENFTTLLSEGLKKAFAEQNTAVEITSQSIAKLGGSYEAVTIRPTSEIMGVNLNVGDFRNLYEKNGNFDEVLKNAFEVATKALKNRPAFSIDDFHNYEKVKNSLFIQIVNADRNTEILTNVPFKPFEDLAIVCRVKVEESEGGTASILIHNGIFEKWKKSFDEVLADALEVSKVERPLIIKSMLETLCEKAGFSKEEAEKMGMADDGKMFVASVPSYNMGAAVLAYDDFTKQASEIAGGSFFVLPSSIHEVLIVADSGEFEAENLLKMVKEVNRTQVSNEDFLADSVYHFDHLTQEFKKVC